MPLRDVAGMLRSFDYAAHAAVLSVSAGRPDDRAVIAPIAAQWAEQASATFLQGYEEGVQGSLAYPADEDNARRLLELFLLEKALYEVSYELNHRPDWAIIPIRGILALLSR